MRRATIITARTMIVLVLAAAALDLPLPAKSRARVRVHLIDRSDSVRLGPRGELKPEDADRIVAWDRDQAQPGDSVQWYSFAKSLVYESREVDPTGTDLAGAIEGALAKNPTELVLYTDGRGDPGPALLLCKARGVPIYVFPWGPSSVRDARIARVRAPASAAPGERVTIEITVVATFDGPIRVRLDERASDITVAAGVPYLVAFGDRSAGPFRVRLEIEDDCPQNNEAAGAVFERSEKTKVLIFSSRFPDLPEFETKVASRFEDPHAFDAVVLDNVTLAPEEQRKLASYVRDFGGALILLGGANSYGLGHWRGTPIEEVSPLRSDPDHKVAVVFGIDSSGSMDAPGKLDVVIPTVLEARRFFQPGDWVEPMTFADQAVFVPWQELRRVRAGGGTRIERGIRTAREQLQQVQAGRKHIILLTDGETSAEEKPEDRRREADELRAVIPSIGLTIVTTDRPVDVGTNVPIRDWKGLRDELHRIVDGIQEKEKANPGPLDLREHPVTEGVPRVELARMNLTGAKEGAQIVGTVGRAPATYPAVAFGQAGRGRVGAFAFPYDPRLARLFARSIEHLAGESGGGVSLAIDPPLVRARGQGLPPRFTIGYEVSPSGEPGTLELRQVGSDVWEGFLPATRPGTVFLKHGRARAAATIPCAPEYEALGVDRKALERIAAETGGRVLRSPNELRDLPRPGRPAPRSGRPVFLVAALVLLLVDMALSTFWKP